MSKYTTARTGGLGDEQNLDELIIVNTYKAPTTYTYFPSEPYYPSPPSGSGYPYGGGIGGGYGSSTPPPSNDKCKKDQEDFNNFIALSGPVSELISSTIESENSTERRKNYQWAIYSGPGYKIYSSDTGVHKKVATPNQWEWMSLTHNSIYKVGTTLAYDITLTTIYAQATIDKNISRMEVNFNVKFSSTLCDLFGSDEKNVISVKGFGIND